MLWIRTRRMFTEPDILIRLMILGFMVYPAHDVGFVQWIGIDPEVSLEAEPLGIPEQNTAS